MNSLAHPFNYDLGLKVVPGSNPSEITICCHGYGDSNRFVDVTSSYRVFDTTLVGFNFPDYGITDERDHANSAYGSIHEILPLLYVLNLYAVDKSISKINLYGFSAGGGAVINALAVCNRGLYQTELEKIGITQDCIGRILALLAQGIIILECPLKSMQEIIDFRGATKNLLQVTSHYNNNAINPIENTLLLSGLNLSIILYFEVSDEVLSNRDDVLFIERLKQANKGTTIVVTGTDGGHNGYHKALWDVYLSAKNIYNKA